MEPNHTQAVSSADRLPVRSHDASGSERRLPVKSRLNVTHISEDVAGGTHVSEDVAAHDVSSSESAHHRVTVLLNVEITQDVAQTTCFPRNGAGCFQF